MSCLEQVWRQYAGQDHLLPPCQLSDSGAWASELQALAQMVFACLEQIFRHGVLQVCRQAELPSLNLLFVVLACFDGIFGQAVLCQSNTPTHTFTVESRTVFDFPERQVSFVY